MQSMQGRIPRASLPHKPQKPDHGSSIRSCPMRHIPSQLAMGRRTQSATPSSVSMSKTLGIQEDARLQGRRRAIPRPFSHDDKTRGNSSLARVVGYDIMNLKLSPSGINKANRPGSAYQSRQPKVSDSGLGGQRRRAPHIQALEWERFRSKPGCCLSREQTLALARVESAACDIREALLSTTARIDFAVIDRAALTHGDDSLHVLSNCLEKLISHVSSFFNIAMASQPENMHPTWPSPNQEVSRAISCKSFLVALRANAIKLPCPVIHSEDAVKLTSILDAGLGEQLLSWCSETLACYSVISQVFRAASCLSKPPNGAGASGSFRRRIASKMNAQAMEESRGRGKEMFRGIETTPLAASTDTDQQGRTDINNKCRMQKFRPPYLVIPETSFEMKQTRKQY